MALVLTLGGCYSGDVKAIDGSSNDCPRVLPTCTSTPPSYTNTIGPLVHERCVGCHFPGSTVTRGDLTTYSNVFALRGTVLTQVYSCAMPPLYATPLSPEERTELLTWLECGAPNN
jgi:hypothetical protein